MIQGLYGSLKQNISGCFPDTEISPGFPQVPPAVTADLQKPADFRKLYKQPAEFSVLSTPRAGKTFRHLSVPGKSEDAYRKMVGMSVSAESGA